MKIELDPTFDLLYIQLREGEAESTVDLDEGVHLDLDAEGRTLGIEFLSIEAFRRYLGRRDGAVDIPDLLDPTELRQLNG